jgi:hypothetical protein
MQYIYNDAEKISEVNLCERQFINREGCYLLTFEQPLYRV